MISKHITIFEGPDGSGKSVAAKYYAKQTDARLVHLGPFLGIHNSSLANIYHEAMLPALLGYQNVVLDRCWISEPIYGKVFRNGSDRLGPVFRRMLDRIALRCSGHVILCLPPISVCVNNFVSRKEIEYLDSVKQLKQVYKLYGINHLDLTDLPVITYDYTESPVLKLPIPQLYSLPGSWAGNPQAPVVLVGQIYSEHKNGDPLLQHPFVSFSKQGHSYLFTEQLSAANISENDLLWVNVDSSELLDSIIGLVPRKKVIRLGKTFGTIIKEIKDALS